MTAGAVTKHSIVVRVHKKEKLPFQTQQGQQADGIPDKLQELLGVLLKGLPGKIDTNKDHRLLWWGDCKNPRAVALMDNGMRTTLVIAEISNDHLIHHIDPRIEGGCSTFVSLGETNVTRLRNSDYHGTNGLTLTDSLIRTGGDVENCRFNPSFRLPLSTKMTIFSTDAAGRAVFTVDGQSKTAAQLLQKFQRSTNSAIQFTVPPATGLTLQMNDEEGRFAHFSSPYRMKFLLLKLQDEHALYVSATLEEEDPLKIMPEITRPSPVLITGFGYDGGE